MKLVTVFAVLVPLFAVTPERHTVVVNGDVQSVIIPIDVAPNTLICAEYRQRLAKPNRSCWDARWVRCMILANEGEQCH